MEILPSLLMQPTDGVAATACTSTEADKVSDAAGGGPPAELPLHLTEKLLCHMSLLESARLATVCKSWAATVSSLLVTPVPHLYVCMPADDESGRRGLVVSVALDGSRLPPATIPSRVRSSYTNCLRCIGATPSGRVAFAASCWSKHVVLVNPITGVHRSIDVGTQRIDPLQRRVLAAGSGGDSLFAVDGKDLVLWRKAPGGGGETEKWSWSWCAMAAKLHQRPINPISSAVNCNGCFYLLRVEGSLSMVDTTAPAPLRMEKLSVARLVDPLGALRVSGHLLESDGEVLFVQQMLVGTEGESLSAFGFEVHRLDVNGQRWTKVNDLSGDRALFVSAGSSFAVRASETAGCRRNCIYFVCEKRHYSNPVCHEGRGSSWGVYSIEEQRVLFEHALTGPGSFTEAMWFLPRVVQCCVNK
ncbi:hypothetical protein EJB05_24380, partial [Eragrostis curvula]